MPYSNPSGSVATAPAPVPTSPVVAAVGPLPVHHSHGRPGHRRSFSYNPTNSSAAVDVTTGSAFASLGALPRRKPASFHLAVGDEDDDSSPEDNSPPKEPAPIASLPAASQQQQRSHGSHSRSSSLTAVQPPAVTARFAGAGLKPTPAGKPASLNTDDEDDGRGLPPLKLRIPGGFGQAGSGTNSPRGFNSPRGSSSNLSGMGSPVPFPTKGTSPTRSRTSSGPVDVRVTAPTPATAALPRSSTPGTDSPRPSFSRTASSPMILANGKPLKSSLKSSSSSPNIPFPSQSILPSRLYAEIASAQRQQEREQAKTDAGLTPNQRHTRAASAPNLPNFDMSSIHPNYENDEEDDEDEAETPGYELYASYTAPSTPSAPKAVHFPSTEEGGLATVRVFKRTAKPVNLLLPGASGGEETETETDGEGYNSGPGAQNGAGYHYGIHNTWGFSSGAGQAGYQNPWDRYTKQNTVVNANRGGAGQGSGAGGYPFPRMQMGGSGRMVVPTRQSSYQHHHQHQHQGQHPLPHRQLNVPTAPKAKPAPTQTSSSSSSSTTASSSATPEETQGGKRKEKKRIVYELDSTSTSTVPKRDLAMFDNVFLESLDLTSSKSSPASDDANKEQGIESSEDDEDSPSVSVSPQLVCTLSGTLLVRNVTYEKHVSVRFTLDDWHTTSEVKASYRESLGSLPEKWRGRVLGDRSAPSSPSSNSYPSEIPTAPPPGANPQWDRFTFSINLSDYARSRSLSSRTLWMVVRYAVPGDVRVPIPKLLPGFNFSSPSKSSTHDDEERWESDLLRRCERDMVQMLVRGLGSSLGSTPNVRQMVDLELRKRQIGVGAGMGREWWDNNASGNYRIGFREREVVTVKPVASEAEVKGEGEQEQERVDEGQERESMHQREPAELDLPPLAQRRKPTISCPPAFNPPPGSIFGGGYSTLSPPQLSTSSNNGDLQAHQRSSSASAITSPSNLGSFSTGVLPSTTNNARRAETNKAMAETTLERLKRLNLRNYAAPGMKPTPAAALNIDTGNVGNTNNAPNTSVSALGIGSTLGGPIGRTSSNPLPLGTPPPSIASDEAAAGDRDGKDLSKIDSSSSETGTNDSTPLTSPLHTPTMGAVDIPAAVRVRSGGLGSEEASPNSEGGVAAVGNWRAGAVASPDKVKESNAVPTVKQEEAVLSGEETTPTLDKTAAHEKQDGVLRPLLSRHSSVVPPAESLGEMTPTASSLTIPIPPLRNDPTPQDLLSPLMEPMMGGATSFAGVMELGTSPPFSSLGDAGSFGGRTLSSTSLNLNLLPDFGSADVKKPEPTRPLPLNLSSMTLKPKQIGILEGIREKSTSSPPRSPGTGSGRNSPAPLLLPRSFSNSSVTEQQQGPGVVVNRVEGITGTVKPPPMTMTPLSSLRDSTTASSLLDTPKPTAAQSSLTGRRVVSAEGRATSPGASGGSGSGSESNASNGSASKSGSGGSAAGRKGGSSQRKGARSPVPARGTAALGLMFTQQGGKASPPMPMSPSSMSPAPGDDVRDPDSIYQAFVKQWCFASAPSPAQAGGFGRKEV